MANSTILGTGIYLPERRVSNSELETALGLGEDFIEPRTGIKERRYSNEKESIGYMAAEAVLNAVKDSGITQVNGLVISRDLIATRRAYSIGLPIIKRLETEGIDITNCFSIDLVNYCPGFVHGVNIASLMVRSNQAENIVVVGSTDYTGLINLETDFNRHFETGFDSQKPVVSQYSLGDINGQFQPPAHNAFLWGCGAGAVVVGKSSEEKFLGFKARGSQEILRNVYGIGESSSGKSFTSLDGKAIYKYAITEVPVFINDFLGEQNLSPLDISALIPHQPNPRILEALVKRIEIPSDKVIVSCDKLGNMIGASVPITYHQARKSGKINTGDIVMFCSFGDSYLTTSGLIFKEN